MCVGMLIGDAADVGLVGMTITLAVSSVIGGTVLVWISPGTYVQYKSIMNINFNTCSFS